MDLLPELLHKQYCKGEKYMQIQVIESFPASTVCSASIFTSPSVERLKLQTQLEVTTKCATDDVLKLLSGYM